MDDEDVLHLVADGEIDPSEIDNFKNLSEGAQELVKDHGVSVDEAEHVQEIKDELGVDDDDAIELAELM